jgi:hypothetical protein
MGYHIGSCLRAPVVTKGSNQQLQGIKLISVHGRYKKLNNKRKRKQKQKHFKVNVLIKRVLWYIFF